MRLLLASRNENKRAELALLLAVLDVEVVTPDEVGGLREIVEDRDTFRANAAKKALCAAQESGLVALADDSGLEVDALGGAPGVRSARFAGEARSDLANNALLLERLARVPPERRGARFVCALALASPEGELLAELEGAAAGRILDAPRGESGFGYDPLFLFTEPGHPETGRTFAELSPAEKGAVGHRGRALRALAARAAELFG